MICQAQCHVEDFEFGGTDDTIKSAKRNQEEFFRRAWELTQEAFNEDGNKNFDSIMWW